MQGVKIDIVIYSKLVLTYDGVSLGHSVSQLASHPKVCQLGVTLHIEQNVASLEEIKIIIRSVVMMMMIITLMSLWIFFLRWRYSRPLSVSQITVAISSSVSVFFRNLRRKVLADHWIIFSSLTS